MKRIILFVILSVFLIGCKTTESPNKDLYLPPVKYGYIIYDYPA